ncbi:hypothetical protein KAI56_01540 [Candidatus Parcubacteria bacterium]|nr:hypothetical protein [Candidatus Parcubacteria bacterium]
MNEGGGKINAAGFTIVLGYKGNTERVKGVIINSGLEIIRWTVNDTAISREIFVRVKGENSKRINKLIETLLENKYKYEYKIKDERSFVL